MGYEPTVLFCKTTAVATVASKGAGQHLFSAAMLAMLAMDGKRLGSKVQPLS